MNDESTNPITLGFAPPTFKTSCTLISVEKQQLGWKAELIIDSDSKSKLTLGSESRKKDNRCTGKTRMVESK